MNYDRKTVSNAAEAVALKASVCALFEAFPDKEALLAVLKRHSQQACDAMSEGLSDRLEHREIALAAFDTAMAPYYRALRHESPHAPD